MVELKKEGYRDIYKAEEQTKPVLVVSCCLTPPSHSPILSRHPCIEKMINIIPKLRLGVFGGYLIVSPRTCFKHALIVYSAVSLLFSIIVLGRFYRCPQGAELMQWFVKIHLGLDAYVVDKYSHFNPDSNNLYLLDHTPASNSLGVADAVLTLVSLGPL